MMSKVRCPELNMPSLNYDIHESKLSQEKQLLSCLMRMQKALSVTFVCSGRHTYNIKHICYSQKSFCFMMVLFRCYMGRACRGGQRQCVR